ncbi:hypothetical protein GUITHDRAFT_87404, partial [Guillardia theta CCMP2712]
MAAPIVVSPTSRHTATVIWLHGLGDNGSGWSDVARQLNLPWIKFLLPNAPSRPVTINMGASMPAWADIKGLSPDAPEDEEGTMKTRQYIHDLIAEEVKNGIPADRIMVGGFSQGAAMACFAALTHEVRLGGCFVLSGYLAMRNKVPRLVTKEGVSTPFFQAHGVQDPVVPFMFGQLSSNVIQSLGVNMKFKQYNMDHSSCDQELKDLRDFIAASVP